MVGQRMSTNLGRRRFDSGLCRDTACFKSPQLAGLSHTTERNSLKIALSGCLGRDRTTTFPNAKYPLIYQGNFALFRKL